MRYIKMQRSKAHQRVLAMSAVTSLFALALVGDAFADAPTTYDLAPAASGITSQITAVLTVILPIAGGLMALMIGWRLLKRMVKA